MSPLQQRDKMKRTGRVLLHPTGPDQAAPSAKGHVMAKSDTTSRHGFLNNLSPEFDLIVGRLLDNTVKDSSGCWVWIGCKDRKGYGRLRMGKYRLGAHQVSYVLFCGTVDSSVFVCHRCDNPPCINPVHLFGGGPRENALDAYHKGRLHGQLQKNDGNSCG